MKITRARLFIVAVWGLLVLCGSAWAIEVNDPIAHWKFDEGTGTIAYDSAGSNDGTIYGATWTNGQIDGALSFDGDGDYVRISDNPLLSPKKITLVAWIYPEHVSYNFQIIGKWTPGDGEYIFDNKDNNDALRFVSHIAGILAVIYSNDAVLTANTWQQVAVTWDGSACIFYVNGVNAGTDTSYSGDLKDSDNPVYIGSMYDGTRSFNGVIDDVRIYDEALSAEEIGQLYLEGLDLHGSELAIIDIEDAIAEKVEGLERIDDALDREEDAYDALEELLESKDYGDLKKGDIIKARQKIHSAMQHERRSIGGLERTIEKLEDALTALGWEPEPEPEPNLVSHWKFDEGTGTIAYDSVGSNDGTIYGATWTIGQIYGALSFDGVDDWINAGTDIFSEATFENSGGTLSAWVYPTSAFANRDNVIGIEGRFTIAESIASTNYWSATIYDGDSQIVESISAIELNKWVHLAATWNTTTLEFYVDGISQGSVNQGAPLIDLVSRPVAIGASYSEGLYYTIPAIIDDVRIYDRALSAEEIRQLYLDGLD